MPTNPMRTISIFAAANCALYSACASALASSLVRAVTAPATAAAPVIFRKSRRLVLINPSSDLSAKPPGFDVLREQRTLSVLFAKTSVQIFQNTEAGVEAHQVHKLERPHWMIQSELQRLVDVSRRRDA